METKAEYTIQADQRVRIEGRDDLGVGQVLRLGESGGVYHADIVFEARDGRRLETFPIDRLVAQPELRERLAHGDIDAPLDFLLKHLAYQFPLANSGGELSNSRTALLPHQILLTHDLVAATRRRFLIADEVGLGKTIETGMIIRELVARSEAQRILIICPAGLIRNWQNELRDAFRLHFDVLGIDFTDTNPLVWETHPRVIASIDTVKRPQRLERIAASPRWDLIVVDEAHHLSRTRYGKKITSTQNYRLAEALRGHTRDLLFLSATPHQGDAYQFWSLVQLLDDSLFADPDEMLDHRGLLNRVMIRRTKREVTDAAGHPIFMRRQVNTQKFLMAARERAFYENLTAYLREGYDVAGLGLPRTTSQQRAVGFVMTTFQKIMSSSPRAIRQALRRRLLALLAREQMELESRTGRSTPHGDLAERILRLQDEMRQLAIAINEISPSSAQRTEADALIAQLKQRLARRVAEEETTSWALDGDEEGEAGLYAETDIPNEATKVRDLLRTVPEGTDRKFDTLVRALEQLRREDRLEKFIIFTQYRETLEFLREELGKLYGVQKIATIKGGPLDDKIAAFESFWSPTGAQFLISTSAGGEGINLQVAHILFNYDLPWNPMAVEQRIGRIHRYGQLDTAQIYNLVAEDTVEERIYGLLEEKLLDIARTIGKLDPVTGQVIEDFRSEILGFLGSSPNYQDLYRKALVDRDYRRTEREIVDAMEKARQASEALRNLTQDLNAFNLDSYLTLRGHFTMEDLRVFIEKAIVRLGGTILPDGEFFRIETPDVLLNYPTVAPKYVDVTFDRGLAMRRRKAQLFGLGHPLVDALIDYLQGPKQPGEVTALPRRPEDEGQATSLRCLIQVDLENGDRRKVYRDILLSEDGSWTEAQPRLDVERLIARIPDPSQKVTTNEINQDQVKLVVRSLEASWRASTEGAITARASVVGLATNAA